MVKKFVNKCKDAVIDVASEVVSVCKSTTAKTLAVGTGVAVATSVSAFAADGDPDAAITNTVTTFTNTFGSIKTAILAVLVFAVGYKLARKWLKG